MENTEPIWHQQLSKSTRNFGRPYYYNIITKESVWDRPEGVLIKRLKDTQNTSTLLGKPIESVMKPTKNQTPLLPLNQKSNEDGDHDNDDDGLDEVFAKLKDKPKVVKPHFIKEEKIMSQDILLLEGSSSMLVKSPDQPTLLNSPDNRSTMSGSSKCSPIFKRNRMTMLKTPIQDRYEQQKRSLLETQKRKHSTYNENEDIDVTQKPVHQRIGYPTIENTITQESKKRLKIDDQPSANKAAPTKRSPRFDLRHVLNSKIDRTASSEYEMEWETVKSDVDTQPQETVGISGEKACNSPSKVHVGIYKRIYLVCDTCSLCDDTYFIEQLIKYGTYLGLPEVVIVIPFGVFNELDKVKTKESIGANARKISRIISNATSHCSEREALKTLRLQDGSKSREPCCGLELESPDDLVLNCCLQQRQSCIEDELPILITEDINLGNKAKSFKLVTHNLFSFKKWARGQMYVDNQPKNSIQESKDHVFDEMEMDIAEQISNNSPTRPEQSNHRNYVLDKRQIYSDENSEPLNNGLQNCAKSYADEVKVEYMDYMKGIIDDTLETNYKKLKKYSTVSKPSWNIFDCISNLRQRWLLMMDSYPTSDDQRLLQQLVALFKKTNMHGSSSVPLTAVDMKNMFAFGTKLGYIFCKKYKMKSDDFLERLKILEKDWNDELLKFESSPKGTEETEDSNCDRVDVAIQHTLSCYKSDFENLKQANCSSSEEWLSLYSKASNFLGSMQETKAVAMSEELSKLLLLIDSSIENLD